jgi:hypothetical protein
MEIGQSVVFPADSKGQRESRRLAIVRYAGRNGKKFRFRNLEHGIEATRIAVPDPRPNTDKKNGVNGAAGRPPTKAEPITIEYNGNVVRVRGGNTAVAVYAAIRALTERGI